MLREYPERAAVRAELLHIEDPQPVMREYSLHGEQRQVREVLVIDRVELGFFDEPQQVRELDADHTLLRENDREAADEVVDVRDVRQHVVAHQ